MRLKIFESRSVETLQHPGLEDQPYSDLREQIKSAVFSQPLPEPFGTGYLLSGSFAKLCGYIASEAMNFPDDAIFYEGRDDFNKRISEEDEVTRVIRTLACLKDDVQRLCTILQHERWLTKNLRYHGIIFDEEWQQYIKNDIHIFHTELRSAVDHVAMVIALRNRNNLPESFEKLRGRLHKPEIRLLLEDELVAVIEECKWFSEIRNVRDHITHHGFDSKVAIDVEANATFFKLVRPLSPRRLGLPHRFEDFDGYVSFEVYSGYYCGLLLNFLNAIARLLQNRYSWRFGYLYWSPKGFLTMAENILSASANSCASKASDLT